MELKQLEYFQVVGHLNSITRAAEQLYVTQPAITLAIQKLEAELGIKLFDRSQKHFSLTTEGQVYLQRVDSILESLKDAALEMQDYQYLRKGSIKVGIPPMIGSFFLPAIFADFQKQYPSLTLVTVETGSMNIRESLKRGELDIGIIVITQSSPSLDTLTLAKGEIQVCLPIGHPLSDLPAIPLDKLQNQPVVFISDGTYVRHVITAEAQRHKFTPHIILSSGQIETLLRLVRKNVGITFLIDFIAKQYTDVIVRPLADPLYLEIGLAWKKEKYLSRATQAFVDLMANSVQTDNTAS